MNLHDTRHKENSKYAHYSRINKKNVSNYNLKKTHPIKLILKKGDCLFIPKGYWHWIISYPDTKAYNIWFNNNSNLKKPMILPEKINCNINNELLISLLGNRKFIIFNENINYEQEMTISKYINAKIINSYLITLNDVYSKNRIIIDLIIKYLPIPIFLNNTNISKNNINFWFNIEEMDTGMHYDDEDGILCIIDGMKEVLLFPPEDSMLLDGYKYQIPWINNKIEDLLYNTYTLRYNSKLNPFVDNKLHNNTLLLFSVQNLEIIRYINNLCGIFNPNNLIYGVKCDLDGNIRYEIYFYTYSKYDKSFINNHNLTNVTNELSNELFEPIKNINISNVNLNNLIIHSLDIYNINNKISFNKPNETTKINLYYNLHPDNSFERPFYGKLIEYDNINFNNIFLFILTDTKYIINNISTVLEKIKLKIEPAIITKLISIYNYVQDICIYNKGVVNNVQIFCIQYFGLREDDFYDFLIKYNYPKILSNFYNKNYKKLDYSNKEITIHFELNNNNIKILRTAFYGSL
jgi:hypothetical protein